MKSFVESILFFIRIYLFVKIFLFLGMSFFKPEEYNISDLKWYIYYLIFDMWFMRVHERYKILHEENEKNNEL